MKLIGYLIMTVCLCAGCIAATTAYVPKLSLPDEQLLGLRIASAAGVLRDTVRGEPIVADLASMTPLPVFDPGRGLLRPVAEGEGDGSWIADTGYMDPSITDEEDRRTTITPALLAALRAAGVERVHVKEFSFGRWSLSWLFGVSVVGLVLGAMLVKTATRREIARHAAASETATTGSPREALKQMRAELEELSGQLDGRSEHERLRTIVDRVGEIQQTHVAVITSARPVLVGMLGLARFAEFMDRFSAFERQLNRAWSAAADEVLGESESALASATELLPEVEEKLRG